MHPEFLQELKNLLHSTPLKAVDIVPLVNKYTARLSGDDAMKTKRTISRVIKSLEESGMLKADDSIYTWLSAVPSASAGEQQKCVYVTGTAKFEEDCELDDILRKTTTPNTITIPGRRNRFS